MKKGLLISLFVLFILPVSVFAARDVNCPPGGPEILSYDAVIINKNGAKVKDKEEIIEYNKIIKVSATTKIDDILYAYVYYDNKTNVVKLEDLKPKKDSLSYKEGYHLNEKVEITLINKEGAYLYSGPSYGYSKVTDLIPAGTKFTFDYIDHEDGFWAYVEYNGKKGWLYTYSCENIVGVKNNNSKMLIVNPDINIYDYPTLDSNIVHKGLNKGAEISCNLVVTMGYSNWCYINFDSKEGWITTSNTEAAINVDIKLDLIDYKVMAYNDVAIYDSPQKTNVVTHMKKYDIALVKYHFPGDSHVPIYYVEYGDYHGWVDMEDNVLESLDVDYMFIGDSLKLYSDFDCNEEKEELHKNTVIKVLYSMSGKYYISFGNSEYWINTENLGNKLIKSNDETIKTNNSLRIFKEPDKESDEVGITSKKEMESEYQITIDNEKWYYINDGDIKGWINLEIKAIEEKSKDQESIKKVNIILKNSALIVFGLSISIVVIVFGRKIIKRKKTNK